MQEAHEAAGVRGGHVVLADIKSSRLRWAGGGAVNIERATAYVLRASEFRVLIRFRFQAIICLWWCSRPFRTRIGRNSSRRVLFQVSHQGAKNLSTSTRLFAGSDCLRLYKFGIFADQFVLKKV